MATPAGFTPLSSQSDYVAKRAATGGAELPRRVAYANTKQSPPNTSPKKDASAFVLNPLGGKTCRNPRQYPDSVTCGITTTQIKTIVTKTQTTTKTLPPQTVSVTSTATTQASLKTYLFEDEQRF